ncbi:hypothetical protein M436DRAFT_51542 [Aureobasidium namibiae CBS 147.97]|uniref:Uncharacterized protein n=1 Tax=Aureobasidium namibiae CBS 147.97 TaxID=1043004 RepID=A0A074WEC6_9PEZI
MKLFARLNVVVLLAILALLFVAWNLPSYHPITRARKVWRRETTEIIVFGDSWSTNRLELPTPSSPAPSNKKLWVDSLCSEIVCDRIYDLAQSLPSRPSHRRGPVIDNDIYANLTHSMNVTADVEEIGDFGHQVDAYLVQDDARWQDDGDQEGLRTTTMIFTVFFGVWELWDFVGLPQDAVLPAVIDCIASMFAQLDRLVQAKSVSSLRPTIIIPKIPDPSFFPRWISRRTSASGTDKYGQLQRNAVILTDLWNSVLQKQVESWNNAHVVTPDFHAWMLEQMREPEIDETGLAVISKIKAGARFTELTQPCVNYTAPFGGDGIETRPFTVCDDPSHFLFWDDTRLSGAAHELLGKHVAGMLQNSTMINRTSHN